MNPSGKRETIVDVMDRFGHCAGPFGVGEKAMGTLLLALAAGVFFLAAVAQTIRLAGARAAGAALTRDLAALNAQAAVARELEAERGHARRVRDERHAATETLTKDFNESIRGALELVAQAAHRLGNAAQSMAEVADDTSRLSGLVEASAERTAANTGTVAGAADRLAETEIEIARQIGRSWDVTQTVARQAGEATEVASTLTQAGDRIGEIVGLINDIAAQTHLLALNATMEAARAGEAGRGFAIVATEVKKLAGQTARATEEIGIQIHSVRAATQSVVTAIAGMRETIATLGDRSAAIAQSVESQAAATQQIASSVHNASAGTAEVTQSMTEVKGGVARTGRAAVDVYGTANALFQQSQDLATEVADFLAAIRTVGDRRNSVRRAVRLHGSVRAETVSIPVTAIDISLGGCRLDAGLAAPAGSAVELALDAWPPVKARVVGIVDGHARLQFGLDAATQAAVEAALERVSA